MSELLEKCRVFLSKHIMWIIGIGLLAYVVTGVMLSNRETTPIPVILKPVAAPVGPKRYVVWDKSNFEKKSGTVSAMNVSVLSAAGAMDIKPMEVINGYTFEGEVAAANIKALGQGQYEVQEEYYHSILQWRCERCRRVGGGGPGPVPEPVPEPTPGPGPTPDPTPEPGPAPTPSRSWGITRVHAPEAQALVDTSQIKICVIDTGIDLQHPNKGNVIGTQGFAGPVQDGQGHGTHTAGTVAGTGGVGVSRSKLLICKGLSDSGSGSSSALAQCLTWCGQQGAQVVSNSWGSPQSDSMINQAVAGLTQKGIYVFFAAGNDGSAVNWPAKLSGSNSLVFAVAASDQRDQITSFSSRGPEIKFISPGAGIVSNWPGGGTRSLDGTSMATPHTAGICAFGIAKGRRPCVVPSGQVSGYQFADAAASAQ
jgi:hypothetical protein